MAGASFCGICGEITSDGNEALDADGNELGYENYSPCQCETGIDSNGRRVWSQVVRYGVVTHRQPVEDAANWCPYEDKKEARAAAKRQNNLIPEHAPHKVVRVTMKLEKVE